MPDPIREPILVEPMLAQPAIVNWNRLEGRPRRKDFDRSLRAEVRDPYWMLCRQWQVGEFRGEDAGSAVKARLQFDSTRIDRYAPATGPGGDYDDMLPLEARVEREPVPLTLALRAKIGRRFAMLVGNDWPSVQTACLTQYAIEAPAAGTEAEAQLLSDPEANAFFHAVVGRVIDGAELLLARQGQTDDHAAFVAGLGVGASVKDALLQSAERLATWFDRLYSQPASPEERAWLPEHLEYGFACSAPDAAGGASKIRLVATEYPGGHLDWSSFEIDRPGNGAPTPGDGQVREATVHAPISFVPSPIEYGGMPNPRWWQFEDALTDLGDLSPATTDLAHLMLAEMALIFGNDWSLVPIDLDVGTLSRVNGVVVTDVFGVRTLVRRANAREADAWQQWNMYDMARLKSNANGNEIEPWLFLPPSVGTREQGAPIDAVTFTKDEMSNLVFALEERIPGSIGHGRTGAEAAQALRTWLRERAGAAEPAPLVEVDATIAYQAGTDVPEHWVPFISTRDTDTGHQTLLQRARLVRSMINVPTATPEPRGGILREGLDAEQKQPYFIIEEEVPRAGAKVSRAFQRTRWIDGRVVTWLGREKVTGRGEGESGLRFDQIRAKKDEGD